MFALSGHKGGEMRYQGSVGNDGVLSEMSLSSKRGWPCCIKEKTLIRKLCVRFEVTEFQAKEAINDLVELGLIVRINGKVQKAHRSKNS